MYIAVDIGGTKTLLATFSPEGQPLEQVKFPTPPEYSNFKDELRKAASQLTHTEFVAGAIGIRGNIDRERGLSLLDSVLVWGEAPVRDDCAEVFNCPFDIENDSKLAGLSEAILLKDEFRKVLYVTVSTGIGSAFIVDGVLDADTINSEIGKGIYEHNGKIMAWEDFASGKAIVAKYNQRASDLSDDAAWRDISKNLAIGLIDAIAAYTPEVVILGGGVGSHYNTKFKQPLTEVMNELKPLEITLPEIRQALHPEEAVIYGCYYLAQRHHGSNAQ